MTQGRKFKIGKSILEVKNISLSFGGVKAITDISFDVFEHEIRPGMLKPHEKHLLHHLPQGVLPAHFKTITPKRISYDLPGLRSVCKAEINLFKYFMYTAPGLCSPGKAENIRTNGSWLLHDG